MEETSRFTVEEAHQYFAKTINRVWELSQRSGRSQAEHDEMLYAAYACTYHWKFAGTIVHQQRGEWLISRVHVALGHPEAARRHAERCFQLTESHKDSMADFDIAYAYEGLVRAYALSGKNKEAENYYHLAQQAGDSILDAEDRAIFLGDFQGGDWFGVNFHPAGNEGKQ